ncbi:hypothetical protein T11_13593 [Trichinella zimbabwensis]|uniref:Uncharacterized protein n=1 Tax=Trichinella zimbabwensis TaxID=268475 RepID=A0A0V1GBL1_9BILA|nr:hypothetical protein T11_13593 [Trichinella zimbabwensis]
MRTSEAIYSTTTGLFLITKFRNFRRKLCEPKLAKMGINRSETI